MLSVSVNKLSKIEKQKHQILIQSSDQLNKAINNGRVPKCARYYFHRKLSQFKSLSLNKKKNKTKKQNFKFDRSPVIILFGVSDVAIMEQYHR